MTQKVAEKAITQSAAILQQGGLFAYPTEAVYGLGCDPFNRAAVERLCALKQRSIEQGLILIAANFSQIEKLIAPLSEEILQRAKSTWPGPYTWVFPRSELVPDWISGDHPTIALRVTAHPIAAAICQQFGGAIISTSANRHGHAPARTAEEVRAMLGDKVDFIVEGEVGGLAQPTPIRDGVSGEIFRL